uniref:KIAA1549 like n=1 Tax=Loxodonta africana TaxID=9785 RepID=G3TQE7_LOXAF
AATDLFSKTPNLPSTTWTFPLRKDDSVTAVLKENEKANMTVPPQALPSKEISSLHTVSRFTSDFSTDPISSTVITALRTNLTLLELLSPTIPAIQAMQTSSPFPSFFNTKSETYAAAVDSSGFPASASKQATAFPSSTDIYDSSTMGHVKKPAITDVFWRSFSTEIGSPSTESVISGLLQQADYDLNGHTANSTSWETRSTSTTTPSGLTSAASAVNPQGFKDIAGPSATAEGLSVQDPFLSISINQLVQQPNVTMVGNYTNFWPTSKNNHARDFKTAEVEDYPSTSQHSGSRPHLQLPAHPRHPLLPTLPSLTSPASLQEMLSDGKDTSYQISSSISPSLGINVSTPLQSVLRYHSTAESPPVSASALFRTPSKVLLASQRPEKWTGAATNAGSFWGPSKCIHLLKTLYSPLPSRQSLSPLAPGVPSVGISYASFPIALAHSIPNASSPSPLESWGLHLPAAPSSGPASEQAGCSTSMTALIQETSPDPQALPKSELDPPPRSCHSILGFLSHSTSMFNPKCLFSSPSPLLSTGLLTKRSALQMHQPFLERKMQQSTSIKITALETLWGRGGLVNDDVHCLTLITMLLFCPTVLFLTQRRLQSSEFLKLNVAKGLTQALRKAFHQSDVSAHVDILEYSHNVTVGYYATKGRLVYLPSVIVEMLGVYGISNVTADLKQHTPNLQSVAVLASPWNPEPAGYFQLKTGKLEFVSQSDNIQSCRFAQTMEQRLQKAFQDAERKVLNTKSNLAIQIVSTSNASQTVTLVYVVSNQSTFLNGTVASSLLSQLSAELVGFYLTYPPLTIAEPLEYPNLDISETTRDYWVITVLQGVDNSLVGLHNQSFARVMEQRLAQLFMMSQQQGQRFKRATTLGSYTVQMVKMQRVPGPKDPAELTYYTLYNGKPLLGTAAAKILSTIDSQRMALTLHHVVLLQADPVVKNPPNNLWIIAAVLAPIAVVTVIIIIITAVLCRKNKNDFKPDTMMNLPQRAKPVQGFDYAKQHLGQQGADEEVIPVTQETVVLPLPVRDAPASQEREAAPDGSTIKTAKSTETRKSRSPSENGSVISNESGKPSSGRRSPQNVMAQQKVTKEEARKRNVPASDEEEGAVLFDSSGKAAADPFDSSSGSVQLIAIKPTALPVVHPASDRSQESAALNGEVNKALKQKSDIEHYRNKLRLKAKRKGYYDFPPVETNKGLTERKKMYEKPQKEIDHILDPDPELCAPFTESKNRQQMKNSVYRSRQSLNSPSPGETEMDLLVTRERPRRGIRNSGYDTEPEIIEETNIDRVHEPRGYTRSRQVKGHSETSTLSSQPSIDEVRQQMHMLLEEAFSLASAGHAGQSRHQESYGSAQHLPYSEVVTSAPGTMTRPRAGVQWVPTYRPEMYQYSLPRPAYRFSQLPEMVMGSPPPPVPPRTGPVAVASLRRSTSDIGSKTRMAESAGPEQAQLHDSASFAQVSRGPVSVAQLDQSALNYSGNTVPAVFAIPAANRPGFTYFIPTPPSSYRNQAMSYAERERPPRAKSVPLPGYIEAYPRSRYQQNSPSRLPRQYSQPSNLHPSLEQAPVPSTAASQQSLAENDPSDTPLTNISTAALVKAIREEVAKLAKKQTDMFEFQV